MFEGERGRDLLVRGVAAAKANSKSEARFFLERFLRSNPPVEHRVQAWRYLGQIADSPAEKRRYLEQILAADPADGLARRDLSLLDGRLAPEAVVDPDCLVPLPPQPSQNVSARVLACRRCGSNRVVYAPDGQALVCEHCHQQQPLEQIGSARPVRAGDHDFATTMWTIKGHRAPVATSLSRCDGCGATFLSPPGALSLTCPYCVSVHVVNQPDTRDVILPDALIPLTVTRNEAQRAMQECLRREGIQRPIIAPVGLYTPVWMFRFTGEMLWTGVQDESLDFESGGSTRSSGSWPVIDDHALVCATTSLPETLHESLGGFDLGRLLPYDGRYLADWPAQTYDITLEDASRIARRIVLATIRTKAQGQLEGIRDLEINFGRAAVDSFQLLLFPFWIGQLSRPHSGHFAFVNGQTGSCSATIPRRPLLRWIDRLLGRSS